jgi:hypothetical protein
MANPWFRVYAEFAHDPKVQMMSEAMQRRYMMLMCMRCSNALVTLQDDEIAFHLRIGIDDLAETKSLFVAKGFIDDQWNLLNWDKRQFASDSSAQRVAKHRAAKKAAEKQGGNVDVTLPKQDDNALDTDTDTDTDTERTTTPDGVVVASDAGAPPPPPALPASKKPECPHQEIIALYHAILPACPSVRDWTPARQQQLRARWNENPKHQTLEYWRLFFEYVATCPFLVGQRTSREGRPFLASLEWLVKAENFAKVREQRYEEPAR